MEKLAIACFLLFVLFIAGCTEQKRSREVVSIVQTETPANIINNTKEQEDLGKPTVTVPTAPIQCKDYENDLERDSCFMREAEQEGNADKCKSIYSLQTRDTCYGTLAAQKKENSGLCFKIEDSGTRQDCYYTVAVKFNQSDYCKRISDTLLLRKCTQEIRSTCYQMLSTEDINKCLSIQMNNFELCGGNADCLMGFAKNYSDLTPCDYLNTSIEKQACLTVATGNDFCSALSGFDKDNCYAIVGTFTGDRSYCRQINIGLGASKLCYVNAALQNKNMSMCEGIPAQNNNEVEYRDYCYYQYALEYNDVYACMNISIKMDRVPCTLKVAYATNDPSICNYVETSAEKERCYGNVIFGDKDFQIWQCNAINMTEWRINCLTKYAFQHKEPLACSYIDFVKHNQSYTDCMAGAK